MAQDLRIYLALTSEAVTCRCCCWFGEMKKFGLSVTKNKYAFSLTKSHLFNNNSKLHLQHVSGISRTPNISSLLWTAANTILHTAAIMSTWVEKPLLQAKLTSSPNCFVKTDAFGPASGAIKIFGEGYNALYITVRRTVRMVSPILFLAVYNVFRTANYDGMEIIRIFLLSMVLFHSTLWRTSKTLCPLR